MSQPRSIDDVIDPGLATGSLAALLRPGRDELDVRLLPGTLVCPPAIRPYVLSLLVERSSPLLVITQRSSDAEAIADGLAAYLGEDRVAVFPAWETLPHERLSPQPATVGRRLAVLDRLCRPEAHDEPLLAIVAPVRAALQPMDPALGRRAPIELDAHWDGFDRLVERLAELGYSRTPQVETRGEFAVRGGIVDIFPTAADHAVRLEFWGDDVESMRTFSVGDQRSIDHVDRMVVDPARELVIDDALRERARDRAKAMPSLREHLDKLADGITFEGVESLVTFLHPRPALLPDFLPDGSGVAVVDPLVVRQRADKLREEAEVLLEVAWETAAGHRPDDVGFAEVDEVLNHAAAGPVWELDPLGSVDRLPGMAWDSFRGDVEAVGRRVRDLIGEGHRVVLTTAGHGPAKRLSDILGEQGTPSSVHEEADAEGYRGRAEIVPSPLREGFLSPELGLAVLAEWDVFGPRRNRKASRRMGSRKSAAETVLELAEGDAIVHRTHGVGVYRGMVTREISSPSGGTAKRDYVKLQYADGDMLFVPSDQVDAIARYQGGEKPSVMSLGGAQWERAKNRVRKAVRDIAAELIRLYAARMHSPGNAFSPDGPMQSELEDAFPHVETYDQLTVADEVKRDMEAPLPMDRLLVGDVGFGKTEVAVRAAAKAIFDGKQVAVLVPTTILAQQHFETFKERFAGFPVELRMVSRFVTGVDRKESLDGIAAGTVDIAIGTHSLIGKTVQWKDLGLVVVDEEQRFGVTQKERLKQLRTSVDVLSMSARPIPRTLEMAVSGIRDMSVIETPPEDRQPVMTMVQEHDEAQIALAIRRELLRDGQIFYLHNQVDTIHSVAEHLREQVPDARIEVAHGQMDERALENVMVRFWEREFDVLVCTTIVESGLDVPNANTLIVERADMLGLAQLYQIRGRVGRSRERAYAYLLYPSAAALSEEAGQRLATLSDYTELGAGFKIAMRDLEIRGAGNLLGDDQSGHVAAIGFELYVSMLDEAVRLLAGDSADEGAEPVRMDLPVDAFVPGDYVPYEAAKIEVHRRVSGAREVAQLILLREELEDRFGPVPAPLDNLIKMQDARIKLGRAGARTVDFKGGRLSVAPIDLDSTGAKALRARIPEAVYESGRSTVRVRVPDDAEARFSAVVAAAEAVLEVATAPTADT